MQGGKPQKNVETPADDALRDPGGDNEENQPPGPVGEPAEGGDHEEDQFSGPLFSPPLYIQRYLMVADLLKAEDITTVVDFGCAECSLYRYIKPVDSLERIICVDVDKELLQRSRWKVQPLNCDYLLPRLSPLTVELYQGSVTDYDDRIAHVEACVMVEIIEHLESDVLEALPMNVFGRLRPKIAFVSTPNSQYNVLFTNFTGVRHWDHKFEWTQQQFHNWCEGVCEEYNYSVTYTGVGLPPDDQPEIGFCTQAAIFRRHTGDEGGLCFRDVEKTCNSDTEYRPTLTEPDQTSHDVDPKQPYSLICLCEHPYKKPVPVDEQIQYEVSYYCRMLASDVEDNEDDVCHISIDKLYSFSRIQNLCQSQHQLRIHIEQSDFKLSEDKESVIVPVDHETRGGRWFSYDEATDEYDADQGTDDNINTDSGWPTSQQDTEETWDDKMTDNVNNIPDTSKEPDITNSNVENSTSSSESSDINMISSPARIISPDLGDDVVNNNCDINPCTSSVNSEQYLVDHNNSNVAQSLSPNTERSSDRPDTVDVPHATTVGYSDRPKKVVVGLDVPPLSTVVFTGMKKPYSYLDRIEFNRTQEATYESGQFSDADE